jgi:DNA-directed RNA polymerase subunit RPC12/RpoP
MKCANHPRVEAVGECAECGKQFCAACSILLDHRTWCRDCVSRILAKRGSGARVHPGWRKLAAACLSVIPGAGHMFLGLMGKGFSLMGLLVVTLFLVILYSDSTGMYWITAYLIPTLSVLFVSYAVFDAMAIADAQRGGRDAAQTEDETMKSIWERVLLNTRTLGWVVLLAGVVGVLHLFSEPFSRWTLAALAVSFPLNALVIPVLLLVFGILLLKRSRKAR